MSHENDVIEILVADHPEDVRDVIFDVEVAAEQMRPLAEPGQGGSEHGVTLGVQAALHPAIAPASIPCTVHQKKRRHYLKLPSELGALQHEVEARQGEQFVSRGTGGWMDEPVLILRFTALASAPAM